MFSVPWWTAESSAQALDHTESHRKSPQVTSGLLTLGWIPTAKQVDCQEQDARWHCCQSWDSSSCIASPKHDIYILKQYYMLNLYLKLFFFFFQWVWCFWAIRCHTSQVLLTDTEVISNKIRDSPIITLCQVLALEGNLFYSVTCDKITRAENAAVLIQLLLIIEF